MMEPRRGEPRINVNAGAGARLSGPTARAKNFKKALQRFNCFLKPFRLTILLVTFFAIIATALAIFGPLLVSSVTDSIITSLQKDLPLDWPYIQKIILLLMFLYLLSSIGQYIQVFLTAGISQKIGQELRNQVSQKISHLPLAHFDRRPHGEVLSIITNDIDTVSGNLNQVLTQVISAVTTLGGIFIMMVFINWKLALITLLIIPLCLFIITIIVKKSQKHFIAQAKYLAKVNGQVEEIYGGHQIIQAFNGEAAARKRFEDESKKLFESAWIAQFISSRIFPIIGFIGNLGYVLICIIGGYFAINGSITVGGIQAFIIYLRQFNQPLAQTATMANTVQSIIASSERIFEFLDEQDEAVYSKIPLNISEVRGQVIFDHVNFGYQKDCPIIHNFSAVIDAGQKIAIVGPTGAGKTTIVKLLMRFYEIDDGRILLDGTDIRNYSKKDLRSIFGMVLQDTWLFNDSIYENIRYGKPQAEIEEVIKAAEAAHVDSFVRTLPDGYQMIIDENATNISQGQKQLLTIARALLANPKVLILDEATSSVDTRTEVIIQEAMNHLMRGRTNFIIAHRLSTIKNADWILVMKDGDIIEQGTHNQLLAQNGFYKALYLAQFEQSN